MISLEERKNCARVLFYESYNCSQSVTASFYDIINKDKKYLLNLAIAFGGGFARNRDVCGAVSAFGIVLGMIRAEANQDETRKSDVYLQVQDLCGRFKQRFGSITCSDLLRNIKGITRGGKADDRNDQYYGERPCVHFVLHATEILHEHLKDNHI